jgi:hypothetical protein
VDNGVDPSPSATYGEPATLEKVAPPESTALSVGSHTVPNSHSIHQESGRHGEGAK